MAAPLRFLCVASYFKGNRFLVRLHAEGCEVYLLTIEAVLHEAWPRHALNDVFAVHSFHDRRGLVNAVSYLFRSHQFDRIVALDDFDIEVAAYLREHFRFTDTGHGDSQARLFRDKLAMRGKARGIGAVIPDFCPLYDHAAVAEFLQRVPGPWLVKPRSEASAAGIRKLHTVEQVWQRIHELGDEQSFALLEEMVPGDLFHVDSLVQNNKVIFAEVNQYHRPLLDVYQGGGIYATSTVLRDSPDVPGLREANRLILEGFGLQQGASHTEFMKAHRDGRYYFIETSARVGGANTAEMVEHASGVNLWSEWAKLEMCRTHGEYVLPKLKQRYGGVVTSLARQEYPDTTAFDDPEIVERLNLKHHIGFVVASDSYQRVGDLLTDYMARIARHHHAVLPAADKVGH